MEIAYCGPNLSRNEELVDFINSCIDRYSIQRVNDAGCGDLFWVRECNISDYFGYDELIRKVARERCPKGWMLQEINLLDGGMRYSDLTLCINVFRHHNEENIKRILKNITDNSKFLIADYNLSHNPAVDSPHKKLTDGESYSCMGKCVDIREYLGEPLRSIPCGKGKRYGIW